jgi:hypothetical protein
VFIGAQGVTEGGNHGIEVDASSNVQVQNAGLISGAEDGIVFSDELAADTVYNAGTIDASPTSGSGGAIARVNQNGGPGMNIVNSGVISDSVPKSVNPLSAALLFDDGSSATDTIDNTGQILGASYSIQAIGDNLSLSNSGTIHGGLLTTGVGGSGGVVQLDNSGVWQGAADGSGLSLGAAANRINNTGTIDAFISMVVGSDVLFNSGSIAGFVNLYGAGDTDFLYNSGTMSDGGITSTGADDKLINAPTGSISGPVTFYGKVSSIRNAGSIVGDVFLGGALTGGANTLTNSGSIDGTVTMTGADSVFKNHGEVDGDVGLGAGETLTNTGFVTGGVTLGSNDTIDDSRGEVAGGITANKSDTFIYHGLFGEETIAQFFAGSRASHDTIQFAANDFGSYAAVRGAMSQVGLDVVIRLDAADSITLTNQTVTNLVSADFRFV